MIENDKKIEPETTANVESDKSSKDGEKKSRKPKTEKVKTTQFKITIHEKDWRLQEIFSRVKGVGQRNEFIKEAIYYYDYILHRAPAFTCRSISLRPDFELKEDEIIHLIPTKVPVEKFPGGKTIKLTLSVFVDDDELLEILSRVTVVQDFVKDAIDQWDLIVHKTSFHSRYLQLKPDTNKSFNNYGTKSYGNALNTHTVSNFSTTEDKQGNQFNSKVTEGGPSREGSTGPTRTSGGPTREGSTGPTRTSGGPTREGSTGPTRTSSGSARTSGGPNKAIMSGI